MPVDIPKAVYDFFSRSDIPLTLSDPNLEDDPLILANAAFYQMTGYDPPEVLGRNCRFLQGPRTRPSAVSQIRRDFVEKRDSRLLIRNHRKNGEAFDNYVYIFTVYDFEGKPVYRIGSQFEVPEAQKMSAFESHSEALAAGLKTINDQAAAARQQVINLADIVGASVRDLLTARLQVLKLQE